jgi:benzoyl-CoA-dihydrodiol lyase
VDGVAARSKFDAAVKERAAGLAARAEGPKKGKGIALPPVVPVREGSTYTYEFVTVSVDVEKRTARLTVRAPKGAPPTSLAAIEAAGAGQWSLRAFRELDDAILRLRFEHLDVGMVVLETEGDGAHVLAADAALEAHRDHWLVNEIRLLQARVLRRVDLTSKSFFSLVQKGSCFVGSLLELALASDRIYMLADEDEEVRVEVSAANAGPLPMSHGLSRLTARFQKDPEQVARVLATKGPIKTEAANALGLVTVAPDEIDWDDDVRVSIEERASLSPDALTGMEASLRFPGGENGDSKIFARLSAWQNWIFQRPNAVGPHGALTKYGQPDRPVFGWSRC